MKGQGCGILRSNLHNDMGEAARMHLREEQAEGRVGHTLPSHVGRNCQAVGKGAALYAVHGNAACMPPAGTDQETHAAFVPADGHKRHIHRGRAAWGAKPLVMHSSAR